MKKIFYLLLGIALVVSAAEVKPDFHASFDLDYRAVTPVGEVTGEHSIPINMETLDRLLQKGVKGKASKIGVEVVNEQSTAKFIHYPGHVLKADSGTIAFWFKPLNWDFTDGKFHAICEACDSDGALMIAKSASTTPKLYAFYGNAKRGDRGTGYASISTPSLQWERGEFRHVVFTWDKDFIRLYIDGILQRRAETPQKALLESFTRLSIGFASANGWKDTPGESLIDEFRAYHRPLTGSEVEELFSSYGFKEIDKSKIPVNITEMKMLGTADGKEINLDFSMSRTTAKGGGFPVEMEVLKDGKSVMKEVLNSSSAEYCYTFKLSEWKDGDYLLHLRPVRETPEDQIENKSLYFTLGEAKPVIDRSVPEPWKPVVFKDGELSALMQKTVFSNGVLPGQLFSEEKPLLREPMRFICNDTAVSGVATMKLEEKHPDFQTVESVATGKGFSLKSRCRFEFDGMMWFELTLIPESSLEVKNAKIEIPLRSEVSTLYNCFIREYFRFSGHYAGALKESVRCNHYKTNSDGHLPVLWMGNEERGLYYFTQDQAGRHLKNREETVRLDPGKTGALFTINLIDYASMLNEPVTWCFGLHVTPVRPFVRNRVFWRASSYCYPGVNVVTWFPWTKIHNVPDSRFKLDNYDTRRKHLTGNYRIPILHYFAGFSTSPANPGYPQHAHEWSITPPAVGTMSGSSDQGSYVFVCPNSISYRNTYLRNIEKCIKELDIDNLYFDNCLSYYCANARHGCGWRDEHGQLYPTSNVLGSRELAKGCYRIHRKLYPQGKILRHLTQTPETPLAAFSDCIMDGESFIMDVGRDENYYNIFKPDFFRASFMGVQFGQPNIYIPQFLRAYGLHFPEKVKAAKAGELKNQLVHLRHFMGYAFVHDSSFLRANGPDPYPIWKMMDELGITDNSPFYGYWNSLNPVKKLSPIEEQVMVSSYLCTDGVLAVMLNDTDQKVRVTLAPDEKILGESPQIVDAETGNTVSQETIELSARELKFLHLKK